jgi:cation diffusion facilitator CzcD-associated flavoprotein CzcO
METSVQPTPAASAGPVEQFDAIIIGAGISGLYQLIRLRQLGLAVRVYEAGSGVGGTWYWNRYPGARFDSESYSYGYSFSEELLQEWDWKEHFSGQPENERYLNYVADKFDLRRDIRFNATVAAATYDEEGNYWEVRLEDGTRARARFLITAVGILSAQNIPSFAGIESFKGESFHTSRWPKERVDFTGKRVGVIGTGATAVQLITEIAKEVGHLTVFQRTANYCAPLRNGPIDDETQAKIKASYPEIFKRTRETFAGFIHDFDPRSVFDVTPEERQARFEELWAQPGFAKWFGNFRDVMSNKVANEMFAEFVRNKIRERVKDPKVAEKLVPKNHAFGTKRVPLESGYYEQFNRDNVLLVDLRESPIERITPKGVKTSDAEYELDVIVYATGFDAVTGPLTRIDIRGEGGLSLKDKWAEGPRTYLGIQSVGFPNLLTLVGPHNGATFCNMPRCIEQNVEWVTDCIRYLREKGFTRIAATPEAEEAWTEHVNELAVGTLLSETDSWFFGANIPGKKRTVLMYLGGALVYRKKVDEVAAKGYEGFVLE